MKSMTEVEWEDVQGPVLSGYGHLDCARYLFVRFPDGFDAHAWLEALQQKITTFPDGIGRPAEAINLAFTWQGLKRLGYPEALGVKFPVEFVSGMGDAERARRLGDTGSSSPDTWEVGKPEGDAIHALLLLKAGCKGKELECLERQWTEGLELTNKQDGWTDRQDHREHFGFEDGISQPVPDGSPKAQEAMGNTPEDVVPTGELVLGYPNAYGMFPATPTVPSALDAFGLLPPVIHEVSADRPAESHEKDFGRNGTYLVFRKLQQNVGRFREFVNGDPLRAAKMVGRWPSGAPLTLYPNADPLHKPARNDFLYYNKDRNGFNCPAGSHIRRANPRDSIEHNPEQSLQTVSRHRILRRGVLFGERLPEGRADDGVPRGLLFVCLNTDIRRQFEFIQQTWLNNPKFAGLSGERDPIVGANSEPGNADAGKYNFTIPQEPVRKRLPGLPRFVTVKGGGYFFLPGITALRFLASLKHVGAENQPKSPVESR